MSKHSLLILVLAVGWALAGPAAPVNPAAIPPDTETNAPPAPTPIDKDRLRGQIEQFQTVIENALRRSVGSILLSAPRGAYLEGYGVVFSTEATLYHIRPITPFSRKPYGQEELDKAHQAALERLEGLKDGMRHAVAEHGSLLGQLKPSHTLAVIVHLYNGVGDPRRPYPSQLIFNAGLASVGDYREGKITREELVRQVRISQF